MWPPRRTAFILLSTVSLPVCSLLMRYGFNQKFAVSKEYPATVTSPHDRYVQALNSGKWVQTPPLVLASLFGDIETVRDFITKKADPNVTDQDGQTALMLASRFGFQEIVEILTSAAADLDKQDKRGASALLIAAENRHAAIVRYLLNLGANPKLCTLHGETFLHAASLGGDEDVVDVALAVSNDRNAKLEDGTTALLIASWRRNLRTAKKLIDAGADVNLPDRKGLTPLIAATTDEDSFQPADINLVTILVRSGANINAADSEGWTPLMGAAFYGDEDVARFLVGSGASTSAADAKGRTAMTLAEVSNNTAIAEYLKSLRE